MLNDGFGSLAKPGIALAGTLVTIVFSTLAVARDVQTAAARQSTHLICHLRPLRSTTIAINGAA